jgi:hypothetical protein
MTKPFLNFRPSMELLEEVESIAEAAGLSNAEITRQLCQRGLEELRRGHFEIKKPRNAGRNKGGPDRRNLRQCGEKIRAKKTGGKMIYVGAMDQNPPVNISSNGVVLGDIDG